MTKSGQPKMNYRTLNFRKPRYVSEWWQWNLIFFVSYQMKEENESIALPSKVLPVQLTCGEYFYRRIWDLIFCEQDLLTRINIGFFQK